LAFAASKSKKDAPEDDGLSRLKNISNGLGIDLQRKFLSLIVSM
jgi:hypothetical protein